MLYQFTASGPTITVQVAFSSTPFATSPVWTDITADVRKVSIHRGRSRELDAFSAGTCSVVLSNANRRYDPEHATGPYVAGLLPMKKIQIVSNYSATTSYLFTGYVDGWPQSYIEQNDSVVNVSATDGFKVLELVDLPGSLYEFVVANDKPDHWWKLNEASGTVAYDSGYAQTLYNGTYSLSPTLGSAGIVTYDGSSTCAAFTGGSHASLNTFVSGLSAATQSNDFLCSGWFKLSTIGSTAMTLVEFSDATASVNRLHVYVDTSGLLNVVSSGATVTSAARVDDGIAHHFGAVSMNSLSLNMTLEIDGVAKTHPTNAGSFPWGTTGWSALANDLAGFAGGSFNGSLANVALWLSTVSSTTSTIARHYNAGANSLPETTGTRIGRVLDFAGIPTSDRSIDTGSTTLAAYDLSGQSALSYINLLSQSESGGFYFLGNGNANFRSRGALITEASYVTSNCTFSDAAGGITYADFTTQYDDQDIRNESRVARSGGATQFAASTTSQATYGRRTYPLSGMLMGDDNEAQARAQFVVQKYKDPEFRVRTLTIKPHAAPTQTWPQVLVRELEDRISVVRTPQGTGSAITKQVLIQSISHDFGANLDWTTTYELAPANVETDWLIYDDAVRGLYDSGYTYTY